MKFLLALQFLTRVPIKLRGPFEGVTGDTLGAINECVEVLGLVALQVVFKL